jgi:hypothetical protein
MTRKSDSSTGHSTSFECVGAASSAPQRRSSLPRCRVQEFIQDFKPSADDLNYPVVLEEHYRRARARRAAAGGDSGPVSMYGTWYPTLRQTLMCLSKIYRCVEVRTTCA